MSDNNSLQPFLLPQRLERLKDVLSKRTTSITLVLENLHKDYNISAILRTCESFGIQDVHVVPQPGEGKVFRTITQGCHKWLSIHRHDNVAGCLKSLKKNGFRVFAGDLGGDAIPLEQTDFTGRIALVFSNELEGNSPEVLDHVDGYFVIPMSGFSQSLNVSVAAGIAIHHVLRFKREAGEQLERIPGDEGADILQEWIKKTVRKADDLLKELRSRE